MAEKPDIAYEKLDLVLQILDDLAKNVDERNEYSSFICQRLCGFERSLTTREGLQELQDCLDELDYGVAGSVQAKRLLARRISLNHYLLNDEKTLKMFVVIIEQLVRNSHLYNQFCS